MENPEKKPISRLTIVFQEAGNVNISISMENVTPLQVAAAAWYLEKQAEAGFFQQEMMKQQHQEANKIAVPNLQVKPPILKRP